LLGKWIFWILAVLATAAILFGILALLVSYSPGGCITYLNSSKVICANPWNYSDVAGGLFLITIGLLIIVYVAIHNEK